MARRVNPEEYEARRAQILAAALELIRDKGYQAMTIADVLAALDISKGAFYHYFASKGALLDGIVDMLIADGAASLERAAAEPGAGALTRLRTHLLSDLEWRAAHGGELAVVARVWRRENNAVLKQRISEAVLRLQAPPLAAIIRQGIAEGVFTVAHPDVTAAIIAGMGLQVADDLIDAFAEPAPPGAAERRTALIEANLEALERILAAPEGSLSGLTATIAGATVLRG